MSTFINFFMCLDLPGSSVIKNLSANAGDTGSPDDWSLSQPTSISNLMLSERNQTAEYILKMPICKFPKQPKLI